MSSADSTTATPVGIRHARTDRLRVLLLNDYATRVGGAELGTLALRDGLRARGHDARVLSSTARATDDPSFADYEAAGTLSRWRALRQTANPSAHRTLRRVLRDFDPHVVHVRMFLTQLSPLVLPLLADRPSVYHAVWYRAICPTGTKRLPDGSPCGTPPGRSCQRNGCLSVADTAALVTQLRVARRWMGHFDRVVANSAALAAALHAAGLGDGRFVDNGVPVEDVQPHVVEPRVLYVGRLTAEKGVDVLIRAFAGVGAGPEAELVIVGDGPEESALRDLARQSGIASRVHFAGRSSVEEVRHHSARAAVHVVPSQWAEPFGRVAVEAMMRGRPVVATASGGLADIVVHGETGLLVPPADIQGWTTAIESLLADPGRARAMGLAGHERAVERYGEDAWVDRFVDIYREMGVAA